MTIIPRRQVVIFALLAASFARCENVCLGADQESIPMFEEQLSTLEDLWKAGRRREYYVEAARIATDVTAETTRGNQSKVAAELFESLLSKEATVMEMGTEDLFSMHKIASCLLSNSRASIEERRTNTRLLARYLGRIRKEVVPEFVPKRVVRNVSPPRTGAGIRITGMDPEAISDPIARAQYKAAIQENRENNLVNTRQAILSSKKTQRMSKYVMAYMIETFRARDNPPTFAVECIKIARLSDEEAKEITKRGRSSFRGCDDMLR